MAPGTRQLHDFCWINILSPEPAAAKDFFAKLLGWTYGEIPGMGYAIKLAGRDVGGLFDAKGPDGSPVPPMIGVMVKVASADAASARAIELGGKGEPAFDVGPQGRMAVLHDPNGANIDVWEGKASQGTDCDPMAIGAPSWFETLTTTPDTARPFYEKLFGWTGEATQMGPINYTTFSLGKDHPVAGMMAMDDEMKAVMSPHWGVYFTVADPDATAKVVESLGGSVTVPAMDIEGVGRFAGVVSPHGVHFYVIRYAAK